MNRKWIVIGSLMVVFFLTSISVFVLGSVTFGSDEGELYPRILIDDTDIRVDEPIQISVENIPDGSSVFWDLGDSSLAEGRLIEHTYNRSDRFIATVIVANGRSRGMTNVTIPVKCKDVDLFGSGKPISWWGKHGMNDMMIAVDLEPGISLPSFVIDARINKATGSFSIHGSIRSGNEQTKYGTVSYNLVLDSVSCHIEIVPCDYSCRHQGVDRFIATVETDTGYYENAEITVQVRF